MRAVGLPRLRHFHGGRPESICSTVPTARAVVVLVVVLVVVVLVVVVLVVLVLVVVVECYGRMWSVGER